MARQVILSAKAFADINRIVEFNNYRNRSETYSKKFIKNLYAQLKILENYKTIGIKSVGDESLVLIWNKYYIFYQITLSDDIEILSIYHQKENISR